MSGHLQDRERSGLVSLSAVSLRDRARGKPQQAIPLGTLLIKAENNKPLRADKQHLDDNSPALGVLGDVLNSATRSSFSRTDSIFRRTVNSALRSRSRNRNSTHNLIYQIEADTEVSVFVNNSLDI